MSPKLLSLTLTAALVSQGFAMSGSALYDRGRSRYFSARGIEAPQVKRKAYLRAAGELKRFLELQPRHPRIVAAQFNLGSIYQELAEESGDRDDAGRALHYFRELVRISPKDALADDALFGVASICEKVFQDFRCRDEAMDRIRREYGNGDMIVRLEPEPEEIPVPLKPPPRAELESAELVAEENEYVLRVRLNGASTITPKYLGADETAGLPSRFYVDIANAHLPRSMQPPQVPESAPVSSIRFGQYTMEIVRIVLDLSPGILESDIQAGGEEKNVVIRIASPAGLVAAVPTQVTPTATEIPEKMVSSPESKRLRIVIDPGHGGEDVGAKGPKGTYEKDVTLAIAKKLERQLSSSPHYEIFMTRTDDRKLELRDRTHFANRMGGDLFVSIHTNAAPRRSAQGVSTYFLDNADDRESLRVAMLENGELALPQNVNPTNSEDYYLEITKASMIKNFHTAQSTDLARNVQITLVSSLRKEKAYRDLEDLGVRSAGFYVLTGAKMPAILIETSFISNPKEEKRLRDSKYQEKMARAIFAGIERFFKGLTQERDHAVLYRQ